MTDDKRAAEEYAEKEYAEKEYPDDIDDERSIAYLGFLAGCAHKQKEVERLKECRDCLSELVDLVEDHMIGAYKFDSFSLQPARKALEEKK